VTTSFPQQATALLTTAGNRPILVNGANVISGATVVSGAAIETPDQTGATLNLPGHFSLEISAKAKLTTDFSASGIKVNLIQGCVVLHVKKGTTGEIDTSRGVAARADGSRDEKLEVCDKVAPAGLTPGAKIGIVAAVIGVVALIPIISGGSNPSPGAP
jgi:hypothetical protein